MITHRVFAKAAFRHACLCAALVGTPGVEPARGEAPAASPTTTTAPTTTRAANPHWLPDGCTGCHLAIGSRFTAIGPEQADRICLSCHDGKKANAELHPIGRDPNGEGLVRPKDWPLSKGQIGCLTCHDVLLACNRTVTRSATNPNLLRGGDYVSVQAFCAVCHMQGPYRRRNPHRMIGTDGRIHEVVCRFCHTRVLDRNTRQRTGSPELRTEQLALCRGCHPAHVEFRDEGHVGVKIKPDMLAFMAAREGLPPDTRPTRERVAQFKGSGARPSCMVPNSEGKIVCTTCHNPHQEGVFAPESPLAFGAMKPVGVDRVTSWSRSQRLCLSCHDM
jgi:predicted CXXCH cytochrome family protein